MGRDALEGSVLGVWILLLGTVVYVVSRNRLGVQRRVRNRFEISSREVLVGEVLSVPKSTSPYRENAIPADVNSVDYKLTNILKLVQNHSYDTVRALHERDTARTAVREALRMLEEVGSFLRDQSYQAKSKVTSQNFRSVSDQISKVTRSISNKIRS